jgi:hypothetical protein
MPGRSGSGAFRVLWLGDPRALNLGSWSAGDGLAYATSEEGPPDARWLWNQAGAGPAANLASAVDLARDDGTDRLGQLLSPAGVRYVVVITALAPEIQGQQSTESLPVPGDLLPALGRQLDLSTVLSGTGLTVYQNTDWLPSRVEFVSTRPRAGGPPGAPSTVATPVLPGPVASTSFQGPLAAGTVQSALAPANRWALTVDGRSIGRLQARGWVGRYPVPVAGAGVLGFAGGPWPGLALAYSVLVWLLAVVAVVGRRQIGQQLSRLRRRQAQSSSPPRSDDGETSDELTGVESHSDPGVRT